ncbi:hypothetical protein RRF57_012072 [Xylaria bambusicola]|uniref:GH64 domain-containing protein n=1 Tax=Xylaria bambusicola TaxID=326684 RepID=A0AAN7UNX8_9PEZI
MARLSIVRAATAFVIILWCSISLAAPHQHGVYSRSGPNVEPFLITVTTSHLGLNSTLLATSPQNISTYLVGESPDPANPSQLVGFVAQPSNGESTTYLTPPAHARAGIVKAAPATASWKVGSAGTRFKTPGIINSGRIYIVANGYLNFYASEDRKVIHPDPHNPTDVASKELWGFIELTHAKDPSNGNENMVVNLSFVDWVSLPLGISLTSQGQNGMDNVTIGGLQPGGLVKVCEALSTLPGFWPKLCIRSPTNNSPLRVMSPEKYISIHADDKDAVNYCEPYINKTWEKYKNVDLKINTQVDGPNSNIKVDSGRVVTCRVGHDDILHCDNDAGDFARPVSRDIYGCDSGPFANPVDGATESWSRARLRPRLCAAFVRSTVHLDGVQPSHDVGPDKYYKEPITNHYARVVHENLIGGSGYAFSYDDVNPGSTENAAGLISVTHPLQLNIHVNI